MPLQGVLTSSSAYRDRPVALKTPPRPPSGYNERWICIRVTWRSWVSGRWSQLRGSVAAGPRCCLKTWLELQNRLLGGSFGIGDEDPLAIWAALGPALRPQDGEVLTGVADMDLQEPRDLLGTGRAIVPE